MNYFNGTDYDVLYPEVQIGNVEGLQSSLDSFNESIGNINTQLSSIDTSLNNKPDNNATFTKELIGNFVLKMLINNDSKLNQVSLNIGSALNDNLKFLLFELKNIKLEFSGGDAYAHPDMTAYFWISTGVDSDPRDSYNKLIFYKYDTMKEETVNLDNAFIVYTPFSYQKGLADDGGYNDIGTYSPWESTGGRYIKYSMGINDRGQSYLTGTLSVYQVL